MVQFLTVTFRGSQDLSSITKDFEWEMTLDCPSRLSVIKRVLIRERERAGPARRWSSDGSRR